MNNVKNMSDIFNVEKKLETVYNSSPVISFVWRAEKEWPVESVSGSVSQLGYTPDDFLSGRYSYGNIVHPDDIERVHMEVNKHSKKKNTSFFTLNYRILTKGGDICWVTERSFIKRDNEGNITHFQGIIIDNTALEKTERELMETGKKYRTIFEKSPMGIMYFDENGFITHCNESCARVFKSPLNKIVGFNVLTKLPDDRLREAVEMVFLGNPGHYTGRHVSTISGKEVFLKAVFTPIMSDDGFLMGGIGIIEDMEGRIRTEELIRLNDDRLEALYSLNQMQDSRIADIAEFTLQKAVELTGSSVGYLEVTDPDEESIESFFWPSVGDKLSINAEPIFSSVTTTRLRIEVLRTRKSFIRNGSYMEKGMDVPSDSNGMLFRYVTIPVFERDRIVAILNVANKASDYNDSDIRQLTLFITNMWTLVRQKRSNGVIVDALRMRKIFESVLNSSPAVVFIWRPEKDWPVEFVSGNISQLGYSVEDFTSGKILYGDIIHPSDLDRVRQEVDRAYKAGFSDFSQEYRVMTKSGQVRWVDERTTIHHDKKGIVSHLQGIFVDVTERKQANDFMHLEYDFTKMFDASDDNQDTFEKLLDFTQDIKAIDCGIIYMLDEGTGYFVQVAARGLSDLFVEKLSHFSSNTILGRLFMVDHPVYKNFSEINAMLPGEDLGFEGLQAMSFLPVKFNGQLVAAMILGSHKDLEIPANSRNLLETISEQVGIIVSNIRKDSSTLKCKEHLTTLLDAIDAIVFIINMDGKILHVNEMLCKYLDFDDNELYMNDFLCLYPRGYEDDVLSNLDKIMEGRSSFCDVPLLSKGGVYVHVRTKFIIGDWGEQDVLIALASIVHDTVSSEAKGKNKSK